MSRPLTEQKVLKKLGIEDFRHLTKGKVISMASMLDKMDPEVAKKAIEQFPEFARTMKDIAIEYKELLDKGLEDNKESVKEVYSAYNMILDSLQAELDKEEYSFEERKYIIEQMKEIAEKIDSIDSENKMFILKIAGLGMITAVGIAAALSSSLGGNTQANLDMNDFYDA